MQKQTDTSIFIDSHCLKCNSFARFVKKNKSNENQINLFSLYDDEVKLIAKENNFEGIENTMYLKHNGKLYKKSTAILKTFSILKFPYSLLGIGLIIPVFFRDYLYFLFAKKRKKDYCSIN